MRNKKWSPGMLGGLTMLTLAMFIAMLLVGQHPSVEKASAISGETQTDRTPMAAASPQPIPKGLWQIDFPDLTGKRQALSQWRGKVLVINFWATWCPPCRAEIPDIIHVQKKYQREGLQFVGIAVDHPDAVKTFAKEFGINYPVLQAETGGMELAEAMGNLSDALPFTIVIDRKGNLVGTATGMLDPDKLGQLVRPLLGI